MHIADGISGINLSKANRTIADQAVKGNADRSHIANDFQQVLQKIALESMIAYEDITRRVRGEESVASGDGMSNKHKCQLN